MLWNEKKILEAIKGISNDVPFNASGVCINTRNLKSGDLFIAVDGGEKYLEDAFLKGAVAAIVPLNNHSPLAGEGWGEGYNKPLIYVEDTMQALIDLGQYKRNHTKAKYVAITGSVGKTGTKNMIAQVLSSFGETYATEGNYNNNYGVPLTLANMPESTEFAVIELGMNHAGEISELVKQVRPYVAIITTVAECHIEFFKSIEDIAQAKSEIFETLNGTAIINSDSPCFEVMYDSAKKYASSIITFGIHKNSDIILDKIICKEDHSSITVINKENDKIYNFKLPIPGKHIALNACGVLGVVKALNLNLRLACKALGEVSVASGRGNSFSRELNGKNITLIDEAYNASPIAMVASINTFALRKSYGRKILVIGDMLELGEKAKELHLSIIPAILEAKVDKVYCCGENMKYVYDSLLDDLKGNYAINSEKLLPLLEKDLQDKDVLLCKSSHGSKVSIIVDYFKR